MGCRIIEGNQDGDSRGYAVLYCSTTMVAFGPVMADYEEAEAFCNFIPGDPRQYQDKDLLSKYYDFYKLWSLAKERGLSADEFAEITS